MRLDDWHLLAIPTSDGQQNSQRIRTLHSCLFLCLQQQEHVALSLKGQYRPLPRNRVLNHIEIWFYPHSRVWHPLRQFCSAGLLSATLLIWQTPWNLRHLQEEPFLKDKIPVCRNSICLFHQRMIHQTAPSHRVQHLPILFSSPSWPTTHLPVPPFLPAWAWAGNRRVCLPCLLDSTETYCSQWSQGRHHQVWWYPSLPNTTSTQHRAYQTEWSSDCYCCPRACRQCAVVRWSATYISCMLP